MGLSCALPVSPSPILGTNPFSVLRPQFHQRQNHGEGSSVLVAERSCRTRSCGFSRLLQPAFCGDESFGVVETSNQFVHPQSESPQDSLQDGDPSVSAPVRAERRLDGVSGLEGRLLAGPNPSGQLQVPQICGFESSLSVQGSLFRSLHGSTSFHTGHGSGVDFSSSSGYPDATLFRRLTYSSFFSSFGFSGFGHSLTSIPRTGYCS